MFPDMEPGISRSEIRYPEVAIRTIKPTPQLPARNSRYFYTTPDATINEHSSREDPFEHLRNAESTENFSYAEPNRLGTQPAYLNVPHIVQRVLTPITLPSAKEQKYGNEPFELPFPHLKKGDLAFYMRLDQNHGLPAAAGRDKRTAAFGCMQSQVASTGPLHPSNQLCRDEIQ